jgi:phage repressor protein C with HTH and peptisase S24 domain
MTDVLSHAQIWAAIDALAERNHLTPSALARKAGLDPTTFNKSKRTTPNGRARWPSTESIAKVLQATGSGLDEFISLIALTGPRKRHTRPLIGLAKANTGDFFDAAGHATGTGWEEIDILADTDENAYALEISGDSMAPLYRDGDVVIVSPAAPVRRGDRVVARISDGEIIARELRRQTAHTVELRAINPDFPDRVIPREELSWMARILWSSQ